ncbi:hypothetical protein CAPTEDRAFT_219748 [Capitella teleta]|uniref:S1 motif domain-containing protein n=1 Tax=Capitella teleta TaxID=283909 RepID=R7UUI1_CAPTE|nr:hypothetical protein CAPTEDRAFT_219748 [Capitella teleta]|eukprot:ELU07552.1 hypothetical protein CAPTEDRAFT_219748 [Capitella teleta]
MDQRLVDQSIAYHGPALLDALEQEDVNVSLPNFLSYSHRVPANADRPRDERYNRTVAQFVAQKADLLFSRSEQPKNFFYDPHLQESDLYAVLPPLEAFMDVPFGEKRHHFFQSIDRGHIVFGQVLAIQESGLIIAILAVEYGPIRELDQLKVVAFCPVRETPLLSHQDIADSYQIKDFLRGVITDVAVDDERILISLLPRSLPREMTHVKMKSEVINIDAEEKSPRRRRLSSGANQDSGAIRKSTDTLRRIIAEEEKSKKSKKSHRRHSSRSPDRRRSRSRSPRRSKHKKSYSRSPKLSHRSKSSSRRSRSPSPKVPRKSSTPDRSKAGVEGTAACSTSTSLKGVPEQYLKIAEDAGLSREELEDFLKKIDVPTGPDGCTFLGLDGAEETADKDKNAKESDVKKAAPQPPSHQGEKKFSEASLPPKLKEESVKSIPEFVLPSKEDLMKPEILAQLMKNLPEEGYNQLAKVFESMKGEKETSKGAKKASSSARKLSQSPERGRRTEIKKGTNKSKGRSRGRSPTAKKSVGKKTTSKGRRHYSSSSSSSMSADVRKITVSAKKADPKSAEKLRKSDHLTITTDSSGSRNISSAEVLKQTGFGRITPLEMKVQPDAKVQVVAPTPQPPPVSETRVVTASKDADKSAQKDSSSLQSARGRGFLPGFIPRGLRNPSNRGGRGGRGFDGRGRGFDGARGRGFDGSRGRGGYEGGRGRGFEGGPGSYSPYDSGSGRGFDFRGRGGAAGPGSHFRGRGRGNVPSFIRDRSRERSRSRDRHSKPSRSRYERSSSSSSYSRSRSRSRGRYHSRSRSVSPLRVKKSSKRVSRFDKSRSRSPPKKSSNGSTAASKTPKAKDSKKEDPKESLDEMIVFFNDLKNRKTPKK